VLTFALAVLLAGGFYGSLTLAPTHPLVLMFTERGPTQYATVLFTAWGLMILLFKINKLSIQRRALALKLVPQDPEFVLSTGTAGGVLNQLHDSCDQPDRFILFNRIEIALSNLRNMGRVSDLAEVLRSQADNDEAMSESTYSLLKGLVWAIPVLGFIGTVQGLSQAVGNFGSVLTASTDLAEVRPALQGVTAGLATAFETTLVALVAALGLHLLMTFVKRSEERLLDECTEYCQRQLLARVRLTAFEAE
jgi:biopolymer transport protein ExbB/TolQ